MSAMETKGTKWESMAVTALSLGLRFWLAPK